jgi:fructuronate reductase
MMRVVQEMDAEAVAFAQRVEELRREVEILLRRPDLLFGQALAGRLVEQLAPGDAIGRLQPAARPRRRRLDALRHRARRKRAGDRRARSPAETLRTIAATAGSSAERLVPALLDVEAIFGTDLPADPRFRAAVTAALDRLFTLGSKATVAAIARR